MDRQQAFKDQTRVALISFILELPNILLMLFLTITSGSLILMMDTIDTLSNGIQSYTFFNLSKKCQKSGRFEYDYGMGKFESFGTLISSTLLYLGLIATILSSFWAFFHIIHPKDVLIYAILLKLVNVFIDVFVCRSQYKINKSATSSLISSGFALAKKNLMFDSITLVTISLSFFFRKGDFVVYLEPAICILMAAYLLFDNFKPFRAAVHDLLDKTVDENLQFKILKALSSGYDLFDDFHGVRTRNSGNIIYIDLLIEFQDDKTYAQIKEAIIELESLVQKEIPNSDVTVVFSNSSQNK